MKAILFDMDGTLLPMEQEDFTRLYFHGILSYCAPLGLAPDRMKEMLRASMKAMVKNDGTVTNAVRFEEVFTTYFPGKEAQLQQIAGFYTISEPNPAYYTEILDICGLHPTDCVMVGNDVEEDMEAAKAAGIEGWLLTDHLLNRQERSLDEYVHGDLSALYAWASALPAAE